LWPDVSYLWPPCVADADIIFLPGGFFYLSFFFFSSPNLGSCRVDAGLKCAAHGSLEIQDAKIAILAPSHNFVMLNLRN